MISKDDLMPIKEKEFLVLLEGFVEGYGCTLVPRAIFNNHKVSGYIPEFNIVIEYLEKGKEYSDKDLKEREKEIEAEVCTPPTCSYECNFIYLSDEFTHSFNLGLLTRELERLSSYDTMSKKFGIPTDIKEEILENLI